LTDVLSAEYWSKRSCFLRNVQVPAVMTVTYLVERASYTGPELALPDIVRYKVELWRADLLSGVLEVDGQGVISLSGVKAMPGFDAHLLLGTAQQALAGECCLG
jgi:hypothetical protein